MQRKTWDSVWIFSQTCDYLKVILQVELYQNRPQYQIAKKIYSQYLWTSCSWNVKATTLKDKQLAVTKGQNKKGCANVYICISKRQKCLFVFKKHFETATETETETKRNSFWGREEQRESVECQVMLLDKFIGRPEKHGHLVEFLFCLCHYTIYYC